MSVDTPNLVAGLESARAEIAGAIKQAATATGASFEYLLSAAKMESNFDPTAAASTSSAHGLYQFIEQTWLGTVKEAGPSLGYGQYADAITKSASGTYSVSDPTTRAAILKLRDDPAVSAAMAGVLTQSNSFSLTSSLGRRPTDSELYMAHFMGVDGATKLITSAQNTPSANAAQMFPNAAAANRSIFYNSDGGPRSVSEVYSVIASRYASAANSPATRSALNALGAGSSAQPLSAAATPVLDNAFYLSGMPQAGTASETAATPAAQTPAEPPVPTPTFRSLYQAGDRTQPLSSAVRLLWGNGAATSVAAPGDSPAQAQTAGRGAVQSLDLFSDRTGSYSN